MVMSVVLCAVRFCIFWGNNFLWQVLCHIKVIQTAIPRLKDN